MSARRVLGGFGVIAVMLLVNAAGPAWAAPPTVTFSSPSAGQTTDDATPTIQGEAKMPGESVIEEVVLTLTSADGNPVPGSNRIAGDNRSLVGFNWAPALLYNGRYTVTARASGQDKPIDSNGSESATASRDFAIEAPPAKPLNLRATLDDQTRVVSLRWDANKEPDLIGYQVQRSIGDSTDWGVAGETTKTNFTDERTANAGGHYKYRVVAIRRGAARDTGVASQPSLTTEVDVPDPPKPPPTTQAPADSGPSGDGSPPPGGSGGGGSSGGGSSGGGGNQPLITSSGKVDLGNFTQLLDQTRAPAVESTPAPDPGFDESLPFRDVTIQEDVGDGDIASGPIRTDDTDKELLKYVAGGLLATVLLMHMIWIKAEVDRPTLQPLPPEQPAE